MNLQLNTARAASVWSLVFGAFHFYWALGGSFGLGDGPASHAIDESPAFLVYDLAVGVLCLLGAVLVLALGERHFRRIPRTFVLLGVWTATVALLLRGFPGLLESALVATDILPNGFLGMPNQEVYGEAHPSAYTIWSMRAVDAYFALGSVLYFATIRLSGRARTRGRTQGDHPHAVASPSPSAPDGPRSPARRTHGTR